MGTKEGVGAEALNILVFWRLFIVRGEYIRGRDGIYFSSSLAVRYQVHGHQDLGYGCSGSWWEISADTRLGVSWPSLPGLGNSWLASRDVINLVIGM